MFHRNVVRLSHVVGHEYESSIYCQGVKQMSGRPGREHLEHICSSWNTGYVSPTNDTGDPGWINAMPSEYPYNMPGTHWVFRWDNDYYALMYKSVQQANGKPSHFFHVMLCGHLDWEYLGMVTCFAVYRQRAREVHMRNAQRLNSTDSEDTQ
jgi:hypothetical protein